MNLHESIISVEYTYSSSPVDAERTLKGIALEVSALDAASILVKAYFTRGASHVEMSNKQTGYPTPIVRHDLPVVPHRFIALSTAYADNNLDVFARGVAENNWNYLPTTPPWVEEIGVALAGATHHIYNNHTRNAYGIYEITPEMREAIRNLPDLICNFG